MYCECLFFFICGEIIEFLKFNDCFFVEFKLLWEYWFFYRYYWKVDNIFIYFWRIMNFDLCMIMINWSYNVFYKFSFNVLNWRVVCNLMYWFFLKLWNFMWVFYYVIYLVWMVLKIILILILIGILKKLFVCVCIIYFLFLIWKILSWLFVSKMYI